MDRPTAYKPGQSGNPNGRPPRERALTTLLERAGAQVVAVDGSRVAGKRLVARLAWEIATTGAATLPDGRVLTADTESWFQVVRWIYAQVDGPPPQAIAVGGTGGGPVIFEVRRVDGRHTDGSVGGTPTTRRDSSDDGTDGGITLELPVVTGADQPV